MYEIALFGLIVSEMFPLNTVEVLRAREVTLPKSLLRFGESVRTEVVSYLRDER